MIIESCAGTHTRKHVHAREVQRSGRPLSSRPALIVALNQPISPSQDDDDLLVLRGLSFSKEGEREGKQPYESDARVQVRTVGCSCDPWLSRIC